MRLHNSYRYSSIWTFRVDKNTGLLEIERDQIGKLLFTFPLRCSVNTKTGGIIASDSTMHVTVTK